ncbi:MAG: hypothetical protein M4579_002668 [Chaenotheca gracillima]|nr:MAG: hypothetical protein M4579_002668 [Chaenotheca gracillima]
MPYLSTSTEWYHQSSLLLQARPTTTRITTKYTILSPTSKRVSKRRRPAASSTSTDPTTPAPPQPVPKPAELTLKTFDPASGTCLKYRTDKAAEVGRLIASLGRLGKAMNGTMKDGDDEQPGQEVETEPMEGISSAAREDGKKEAGKGPQAGGASGGGGGGKGKKKKGGGKK